VNALPRYEFLRSLGFAVFCWDYRGFGDSTGWPDEEGLRDDALAVWDFVTQTLVRVSSRSCGCRVVFTD
jgi:alpha/beta superfamily hydrolase